MAFTELSYEVADHIGVGSTAAVTIHAATQWWGAYRLGVALVPWAGWNDHEVRRIIRLARTCQRFLAMEVVAWNCLPAVADTGS